MNFDTLKAAAMPYIADATTWIQGNALILQDFVDGKRLMTPPEANLLIYAVTAVFMVPVVHLWLKRFGTHYTQVMLMNMAAPLGLLALLQVPAGFAGTPDDNCGKYDGGHLVYTLVNFSVVPAKEGDVYGDGVVILLVRAPARWGNDTHQCRLTLENAKAKEVYRLLLTPGLASRFSEGAFTFSFGGREERPNVKIRPLGHPPKASPPEVPESKKQGA